MKKLKPFIVALVLCVTCAQSDVLWHQPWDEISPGRPAQEFTDRDNRAYSVWLFDDFSVPEPGWWLDRVTVYGIEQGTPAYNLAISLSISTAPNVEALNVVGSGTEVVLEPGTWPTSRRANLVFELNGLYLAPGTYYLNAIVRRPYDLNNDGEDNDGGQWFWLTTSPTRGQPFYLHNPAGGWSLGRNPVGGGWGTEQDLAFTIEGRNAIAVSGQVRLSQFDGDITQVPVIIELRNPGSTEALEAHTLSLDSAGRYLFYTLRRGTFDISAKASHWLRQTRTHIAINGDVTVNFTLTNGDIDGDNEVTLFDFGALVAAFGSMPGDNNWNPNADLDGDNEVTLFDFGVLVGNFGEIGDE